MARCRHYDNVAVAAPPSPPSVNGGDRRPKRPRVEEGDDDFISALPDDILIGGIVSRLTIRDAVATGAVSARWRHLWKHAPRISLRPSHLTGGVVSSSRDDDAQAADRLADAASSVLRHHRGAAAGVVDRLVLALPLTPSRHAAVLDQSVEFAASSRTQELHLSLAAAVEHPYDFPHWHFAGGGRLRRLVLSDVGLDVITAQQQLGALEGLAQLTQLHLTRVAVDDAGVASILAACAALTVLELKECHRLVHVAASHDGMRVLNVGHKVDIKYLHTPTVVRLIIMLAKECPLDCVAIGGGAMPKLKRLFLQFPSPLEAHHQLQRQGWRFGSLSQLVLLFNTPWREHVASVASLLVAAPFVKELRVEAYGDLPVPPPSKQMIQWPKHCSPKRLESIVVGGFSGEPELMELAFFLLQKSPAIKTLTVDTHRRHFRSNDRGWTREETEDPVRCYYARGVLWKHLAPRIPSTVKLTVI
ncbi:hypothetical protein HU200_028067 [Digitaria exilis]|uniref:At1g61320/AtMIF1 LRR domain-containing protein n=1 Tax=Digitaria exilis TaxID=1010633 RepID=A0A835EQH2_9POAL|nr:hypothetical protein HU200_028067 [Digitaria exilis]